MSIRPLVLPTVVLLLAFAGCAHTPPEHQWIRAASTQSEQDRDLSAARAEAWKTYPEWQNLGADRQAALRKKSPRKNDAELEEELAKMRHSLEALYMETHGWQLVIVDSKGRMHAAHTH